ncbi:hypothetical protein [Desulfotomaculum nigrificans]|uniref:hypothetical protein n=1 Tax=Desulfotomaculum nigrificans TaxID=1565 RepID=UPI0001FAE6A6|nr:hypothetical protein [Desulfotomaculum nigrificans]
MPDLRQFGLDILLALAPVLAGWTGLMVHRAANWLKEKLAAQELWFYLDLLDRTAAAVVRSLMPKIEQLKSLNENRKLTPQQIHLVQQEAKGLVLNQLSATARQALAKACQDLDSVVASRLEAEVFNAKSSRPKQPPAGLPASVEKIAD